MHDGSTEQRSRTWWITAVIVIAVAVSALLYVRSHRNSPNDELTLLSRQAQRADIVYFYQTNCHDCAKAQPLVREFVKNNGRLSMVEIESSTMVGIQIREQFDLGYRVTDKERQEVPAIFCKGKALVGEEAIHQGLPELAKLQASSRGIVPSSEAAASLVKRFRTMGILSVIIAGLVDSINPCAIAVLIFLISYLAATGSSRDIARTGLMFIAGVFIAYFVLGLGLLNLVTAAAHLKWFAKVLFPVFALGTGILAVLSFLDSLAYRRQRGDQALLGLSKSAHAKIHDVVRKRLRGKAMMWTAMITGFSVSLLELACTGQVYLPTIIYVSSLPDLGLKATGFLAIYNLAFVAPLAVILLCARYGTQASVLVNAARKYTAASKLCLALLFLAMFVYMLLMSITVLGSSGM